MMLARLKLKSFMLAASAAGIALAAGCAGDESTAPRRAAPRAPSYAASTSAGTFTLSSVTPPIECTDASGAVTTVTGGTLSLTANGKFTATFTTRTTSGDVVTTSSYTEKGTFTQSGSTVVFKVPGAGSYTAILDNGTLTITDYPFCGTAHTAVFTQVA